VIDSPAPPPVRLDGDVIVVTGAGRGLGRAYALALAARGARVVVNARRPAHAEGVAAEIRSQGGEAVAAAVPVGDPDDAERLIGSAVDHFGTVHAVVHNAGTMRNGAITEQTAQTLDDLVALHLAGPFHITRAAWPLLRATGRGRVVLTGSSAMFGIAAAANYAASKAAVVGLGRALACEGEPSGIRVNVVLPQAATDIRQSDPSAAEDPARAAAVSAAAAEHAARLAPGVAAAVREIKPPEAVAPLVVHLASAACATSGEIFAAGCGRFARVLMIETRGWIAPSPYGVEVEDVAARMTDILATDEHVVVRSVYDEIEYMARMVGAWS